MKMSTLWSGHTGCDQYQLTVYFLDLNVVGLRIADGDLLLKFALSEDKTFLECEERKKQKNNILSNLQSLRNYSHTLLLGEYLSKLLNEILTDCNNKEDKFKKQANKKQRYHIHVANKLYNIHSCFYLYIRSILNSVGYRVTDDLGFRSKVRELPQGSQG